MLVVCLLAIFAVERDFFVDKRGEVGLGPLMPDVSYPEVLREARESVESGLAKVQDAMLEVAHQAPGQLSEYLKALLARKGKRIRSTFLLLLAATGSSRHIERTIRVCAAIELIHLASLVHDDIIDDSDLRRNEKTAHKRWGNRSAVLLGDFILAQSMEMIWTDRDHRIPLSISRASSRLIAGEVMEVEHAGNVDLTLTQYLSVIEGKTAALMQACGECGAILAGFGDALILRCADLGRNFGVAFQMVDDLLDLGYGAANLDKQTFSDLKNGFLTLPLILFFSSCSPLERQDMLSLLSDPKDNTNQQRIQSMLQSAECFERARKMAFEKVEECMQILELLPANESSEHLKRICGYMIERSA